MGAEVDDQTVDRVGNEPLVHREAHRRERRVRNPRETGTKILDLAPVASPARFVIHGEPFWSARTVATMIWRSILKRARSAGTDPTHVG